MILSFPRLSPVIFVQNRDADAVPRNLSKQDEYRKGQRPASWAACCKVKRGGNCSCTADVPSGNGARVKARGTWRVDKMLSFDVDGQRGRLTKSHCTQPYKRGTV